MVTVKADDGANMDTLGVRVVVTNADDPGAVSLSVMTPVVGTTVTAMLDDPDSVVSVEDLAVVQVRGCGRDLYGLSTTLCPQPIIRLFDDVGYYLRATGMYTDAFDSGKEAVGLSVNKVVAGGIAVTGPSSVEYEENGVRSVATLHGFGPRRGHGYLVAGGRRRRRTSTSAKTACSPSRNRPDFENAVDMGLDNTYMVTVKAYDGTYVGTQNLRVMVTNAEEMGTVALSEMDPVAGTMVIANLEDPDEYGVPARLWQWAKSSDGTTFTDIAGATSE